MHRTSLLRAATLLIFCIVLGLPVLAFAQTEPDTNGPLQALEERADAIAEQDKLIADLRKKINASRDATERSSLQAELDAAMQRKSALAQQFSGLATGVDSSVFASDETAQFDLQREIEELIRPLLFMMKAATEESRQIENLRRTISEAEDRLSIAQTAITNLDSMSLDSASPTLKAQMEQLKTVWLNSRQSETELIASLRRQLDLRLTRRQNVFSRAGEGMFGFMRDRGWSFILGIGALLIVFVSMRLVYYGARKVVTRKSTDTISGFVPRLVGLVYHFLTIVLAVFAMLAIFDWRNDWFLLAATLLLLFALGWTIARIAPRMMDQLIILLNLGAVREGERVIFDELPWLVERLDLYCTLRNPVLEGGMISLPVRQLIGLHSRRMVKGEPWFPTLKGHWILLDGETLAQVILQTPEFVELKRVGGAEMSIPTNAFRNMTLVNLSKGFRLVIPFGIDYRHQSASTDAIPKLMTEALIAGFHAMLPHDAVRKIVVDLAGAGASSLDMNAILDLSGDVAREYENLRRAASRILVDACNTHGWVIPFQQIVVHQGSEVIA